MPEPRSFEVGQVLLAREVWKGYLWRARPVICVADSDGLLVHWEPTGTPYIVSTSRGFPEREGLSASNRQVESLATCNWNYTRGSFGGSKLAFVAADSWSSVELTWSGDGRFVHWYVNFQLPADRHASGYDSLDLVIDLVVEPDGSFWWKDTTEFEQALDSGVFPESYRDEVQAATEEVMTLLDSRSGPFDPKWLEWRPPNHWPPTVLPDGLDAGLAKPAGAVEV
ncbi:MAG TPA: DUF402 domain-containing protein [Acidimicrobiales bacterium]|nr:DUF402 domain-containing protein [Acidimicrobiales bacterium]